MVWSKVLMWEKAENLNQRESCQLERRSDEKSQVTYQSLGFGRGPRPPSPPSFFFLLVNQMQAETNASVSSGPSFVYNVRFRKMCCRVLTSTAHGHTHTNIPACTGQKTETRSEQGVQSGSTDRKWLVWHLSGAISHTDWGCIEQQSLYGPKGRFQTCGSLQVQVIPIFGRSKEIVSQKIHQSTGLIIISDVIYNIMSMHITLLASAAIANTQDTVYWLHMHWP